MAELNERRRIYYIPDNYGQEGRILQGAVKTKNLIQGIIIAVPFALLGLALGSEFKLKIVLAIILAGPFLCAGIVGFNGDSLFLTARSFRDWRKNRGVKLYNPNPTPFYVSPTDTIFASELTKDRLVGAYEEKQKKRLEEHLSARLIEGETFDFADDPTVKRFHNDNLKPEAEAAPVSRVFTAVNTDLDELFGDFDMSNKRRQPLDMGDDDLF